MKTISVDLGMGPDPTSLVVIDAKSWEYVGTTQIEKPRSTTWQAFFRDPDGNEVEYCPPPDFHLRHIERMPVGAPCSRVVELVQQIERGLGPVTLAMDATGVGTPAVELFKAVGLFPWVVTVTAGTRWSRPG